MPLSWNEIRDSALAFSREWAEECSEDAEVKSFWDGFFNVFGITRRRVAFLFERYQQLIAPLAMMNRYALRNTLTKIRLMRTIKRT